MQDLTQFDPTIEKLTALVAESAGIVEVNIDDPQQIEKVKKARINLRNARVAVEKAGKTYRADALAYQKAVIAKENSLIAIIEPEEQRLKVFERSAELAAERRIRVQQLPERKARLITLGINIEEKYLLEMDSVTFESSVNTLVAEKNEKARLEGERIAKEKQAELDKREFDLKEGERKLEQERLTREREEQARKEERERIEHEAKEKADREKRDAEYKAKIEAEEKAKLEKQKVYKKFLADNGYTKENASDFKEENTGEFVVLWKKVATFKI